MLNTLFVDVILYDCNIVDVMVQKAKEPKVMTLIFNLNKVSHLNFSFKVNSLGRI